MIVRVWFGHAAPDRADAYVRHVTSRVFPGLAEIRGHRGALLLQRSAEGGVEFVVLTLWDSMDAVREFAGPDPERAVVEPNARAVLSDFDELVRHYDVISGSLGT